ncbi:MAG: histidine phosphatase family protein [Bacteroidota bacterium]
MKTIHFVRHAKSSWSDATLEDHDRPLNDRGRRDAPRMAQRLAAAVTDRPDGILTSTAKRARQTAKAFREAFGLAKDRIIKEEALYHAWPEAIEEQVKRLPADWDHVLVFGHNPGYTEVANRLQNDAFIGNVPTCGIVTATATVENWADFSLSNAQRTGYLYPKQLI